MRGVHLIVAPGFCKANLWDVTIFHSFQPVDLFLLDRNAVSSHKIWAMDAAKQAFLGTPFRH